MFRSLWGLMKVSVIDLDGCVVFAELRCEQK